MEEGILAGVDDVSLVLEPGKAVGRLAMVTQSVAHMRVVQQALGMSDTDVAAELGLTLVHFRDILLLVRLPTLQQVALIVSWITKKQASPGNGAEIKFAEYHQNELAKLPEMEAERTGRWRLLQQHVELVLFLRRILSQHENFIHALRLASNSAKVSVRKLVSWISCLEIASEEELHWLQRWCALYFASNGKQELSQMGENAPVLGPANSVAAGAEVFPVVPASDLVAARADVQRSSAAPVGAHPSSSTYLVDYSCLSELAPSGPLASRSDTSQHAVVTPSMWPQLRPGVVSATRVLVSSDPIEIEAMRSGPLEGGRSRVAPTLSRLGASPSSDAAASSDVPTGPKARGPVEERRAPVSELVSVPVSALAPVSDVIVPGSCFVVDSAGTGSEGQPGERGGNDAGSSLLVERAGLPKEVAVPGAVSSGGNGKNGVDKGPTKRAPVPFPPTTKRAPVPFPPTTKRAPVPFPPTSKLSKAIGEVNEESIKEPLRAALQFIFSRNPELIPAMQLDAGKMRPFPGAATMAPAPAMGTGPVQATAAQSGVSGAVRSLPALNNAGIILNPAPLPTPAAVDNSKLSHANVSSDSPSPHVRNIMSALFPAEGDPELAARPMPLDVSMALPKPATSPEVGTSLSHRRGKSLTIPILAPSRPSISPTSASTSHVISPVESLKSGRIKLVLGGAKVPSRDEPKSLLSSAGSDAATKASSQPVPALKQQDSDESGRARVHESIDGVISLEQSPEDDDIKKDITSVVGVMNDSTESPTRRSESSMSGDPDRRTLSLNFGIPQSLLTRAAAQSGRSDKPFPGERRVVPLSSGSGSALVSPVRDGVQRGSATPVLSAEASRTSQGMGKRNHSDTTSTRPIFFDPPPSSVAGAGVGDLQTKGGAPTTSIEEDSRPEPAVGGIRQHTDCAPCEHCLLCRSGLRSACSDLHRIGTTPCSCGTCLRVFVEQLALRKALNPRGSGEQHRSDTLDPVLPSPFVAYCPREERSIGLQILERLGVVAECRFLQLACEISDDILVQGTMLASVERWYELLKATSTPGNRERAGMVQWSAFMRSRKECPPSVVLTRENVGQMPVLLRLPWDGQWATVLQSVELLDHVSNMLRYSSSRAQDVERLCRWLGTESCFLEWVLLPGYVLPSTAQYERVIGWCNNPDRGPVEAPEYDPSVPSSPPSPSSVHLLIPDTSDISRSPSPPPSPPRPRKRRRVGKPGPKKGGKLPDYLNSELMLKELIEATRVWTRLTSVIQRGNITQEEVLTYFGFTMNSWRRFARGSRLPARAIAASMSEWCDAVEAREGLSPAELVPLPCGIFVPDYSRSRLRQGCWSIIASAIPVMEGLRNYLATFPCTEVKKVVLNVSEKLKIPRSLLVRYLRLHSFPPHDTLATIEAFVRNGGMLDPTATPAGVIDVDDSTADEGATAVDANSHLIGGGGASADALSDGAADVHPAGSGGAADAGVDAGGAMEGDDMVIAAS